MSDQSSSSEDKLSEAIADGLDKDVEDVDRGPLEIVEVDESPDKSTGKDSNKTEDDTSSRRERVMSLVSLF